MEKNNCVYIIGHRNPDTDSVCSAIGYADIKNRTEKGMFIPRRAGHLNAETEFVLNYFNVEKPQYMPDAATQLKEVEYHKLQGISDDCTVRDAWDMMREENVNTLTITDENNFLEGIITINDIATSFMDTFDNGVLSAAHTQFKAIADTLDGKIIVGDGEKYFEKGRVVIGAFRPEMMEQFIEANDLVIMGNRAEDQLKAFDLKASCIVVGLGAEISPSIKTLAEVMGCMIISSPMDTYAIARRITQAIPVKHLMKKDNLITFTLDDKVDDIKEIMSNSRHRSYPVLDEKGHCLGTVSRRNMIGAKGKKLILVDHNEKSQAVLHVNETRILEIIDHHRIGSLETISPIMFRNQPVGCTATILHQIYEERELEIPANIAGLLMSAIISDTLMFRSPTCTPADVAAAKDYAKIAGVDNIEEYASKMFKAGSNLSSKTAEEIFHQDFKKFVIEKNVFGVGQISSMDSGELDQIKEKIMPQMDKECQKGEIHMMYFMLTNILKETTKLVFVGDGAKELVESAFNIKAEDDFAILEGVVSRKKQLIPAFAATLQQ